MKIQVNEMFRLLLLIISYGALVLLLMPATGAGMIGAAVFFTLGVCVMVYKKVHKATHEKRKQYGLVLAAALTVLWFGLTFYNRWLPSSKMQAIASMLHMSIEAMLLMGSLMLTALSVYIVYSGLLTISNQPNNFRKNIMLSILAAVVMVITAQVMINIPIFSMGIWRFTWGVLTVALAILVLYCLFGRGMPAVLLGSGTFMVISTVNVYVYRFRGRMFEPVDIFSAGTAMNVADNYNLFPIPLKLLVGWGIFAVVLLVVWCTRQKREPALTAKNRFALLALCAVGSVSVFFYASNLKTYHWQKEGASFNGYILDFTAKFKEISASKPANYSKDLISELSDKYAENVGNSENSTVPPHIIVVMDEAFSDLRVAGELATNQDVMPFISSLKEDTISGYTLTSVYGGNTANSEYEFLTGNSLAWLSPNVVPYQQYVRSSTYSMVSYLKSEYHYKCVAMHPFHSSGWNRPAAYEHLGFDRCYFLEDFPQLNFIREYVSDQEMFEFLIETYEEEKGDPLFLFGVTMQNHGGYTYTGDHYTQTISLEDFDGKFPEVEQYLSLIHETDKAVEQLITYFREVEENVVIVFYGDHQPKLDESFYRTISGKDSDTLEEQQKRYKVPFFIWANYDIEEACLDCTSLNYLSSYVYEAAGISLPPYNRFLREMEEKIPSINANGFYSPENGGFVSFDDANEEESRWLNLYEVLQYNNIFDKKQKNEALFPSIK